MLPNDFGPAPQEQWLSTAVVPWAGSEAVTSRWKSPYPITNPITWHLQVRWELPDRNPTMDHLVLCLVSDSSQAWESHSDASYCQSADAQACCPLNEGIELVMLMVKQHRNPPYYCNSHQSQPQCPYSLILEWIFIKQLLYGRKC